jgi:hypothetical protein
MLRVLENVRKDEDFSNIGGTLPAKVVMVFAKNASKILLKARPVPLLGLCHFRSRRLPAKDCGENKWRNRGRIRFDDKLWHVDPEFAPSGRFLPGNFVMRTRSLISLMARRISSLVWFFLRRSLAICVIAWGVYAGRSGCSAIMPDSGSQMTT